MKKIAVSACLLGDNVRYDGTNKLNEELINVINETNIIKICPESIFNNPHLPIENKNNRSYMKDKSDVTDILRKSCLDVFDRIKDCDFVILKSKSPTCGHNYIYDGNFNGTLIEGDGVLCKLLLENNIKVYTELDIDKIKKELIA